MIIIMSAFDSAFAAAALVASVLLYCRAKEADNSMDYVEGDQLKEQSK